jgi:hypothetical protein
MIKARTSKNNIFISIAPTWGEQGALSHVKYPSLYNGVWMVAVL